MFCHLIVQVLLCFSPFHQNHNNWFDNNFTIWPAACMFVLSNKVYLCSLTWIGNAQHMLCSSAALLYCFKGCLWDQRYILNLHPHVWCIIEFNAIYMKVQRFFFLFVCFKLGCLSCEQEWGKKSCLLISEKMIRFAVASGKWCNSNKIICLIEAAHKLSFNSTVIPLYYIYRKTLVSKT